MDIHFSNIYIGKIEMFIPVLIKKYVICLRLSIIAQFELWTECLWNLRGLIVEVRWFKWFGTSSVSVD